VTGRLDAGAGDAQHALARGVEEDDLPVGVGHHHAVGDAFQNSAALGRFHLLGAQQVAQPFGLVADQPVEFGVVDGRAHLVGGGGHQPHLVFVEGVGLRAEQDHRAQRVLVRHERHSQRALVAALVALELLPAWIVG